MKRLLSVSLICFILLIGLLVTPAFAANDVKVMIEGEKVTFDSQPVIRYSRVLVPVRQVVESIGGDVTWNPENRTVNIVKDQKNIILEINSKIAKVNGSETTLDVPALVIGGRTMIPLRFVGENLDAEVLWDPATSTVNINIPTKFNEEAFNLFTKAYEKSTEIKQVKSDFDAEMSLAGTTPDGPMNFNFKINGTVKADSVKPAFDFDGKVTVKKEAVGVDIGLKMVMVDNSIYFMDPTTGKWSKETIPAEDYSQFKGALDQQKLYTDMAKVLTEEVKKSGAIRNIDFVGEKNINGVNTKGVYIELSGLKVKKLLKQMVREIEKSQPADTEKLSEEDLDEALAMINLSRIRITYWIGSDNRIYKENMDLKCSVVIDETEATMNIIADINMSEFNKPQNIVAPVVDQEASPGGTTLLDIL